jgi:hypothetical protein
MSALYDAKIRSVTVLDRVLVALGYTSSSIGRDGQSPLRLRIVIAALVLLSLLPTVAISLITIPSETSFDDLRAGRYRGLGWLRLEGDLRAAGRAEDGRYLYALHDPADDSVAVTVYAPGPLPTGPTQVTGQARTDTRLPDTFQTFYADATTEPARHDPWLLIALPALLAVLLVLGERIGYPVMRDESRTALLAAAPLRPGEEISAYWSGQIGSDDIPLGESMACSVAVDDDGEVALVHLRDERGTRDVRVRRATPKVVGRVCRMNGCRPGIEVHGTGSDILLEVDSTAERDRLAASVL